MAKSRWPASRCAFPASMASQNRALASAVPHFARFCCPLVAWDKYLSASANFSCFKRMTPSPPSASVLLAFSASKRSKRSEACSKSPAFNAAKPFRKAMTLGSGFAGGSTRVKVSRRLLIAPSPGTAVRKDWNKGTSLLDASSQISPLRQASVAALVNSGSRESWLKIRMPSRRVAPR